MALPSNGSTWSIPSRSRRSLETAAVMLHLPARTAMRPKELKERVPNPAQTNKLPF